MIRYGMCIDNAGPHKLTLEKMYKLSESKYGSSVMVSVICDDSYIENVFIKRFQIIPKEVLDSDLYQAIYGLTKD